MCVGLWVLACCTELALQSIQASLLRMANSGAACSIAVAVHHNSRGIHQHSLCHVLVCPPLLHSVCRSSGSNFLQPLLTHITPAMLCLHAWWAPSSATLAPSANYEVHSPGCHHPFGLDGWRFAFVSVALLSLAIGAATFLLGRDPRFDSDRKVKLREEAGPAEARSFRQLLRDTWGICTVPTFLIIITQVRKSTCCHPALFIRALHLQSSFSFLTVVHGRSLTSATGSGHGANSHMHAGNSLQAWCLFCSRGQACSACNCLEFLQLRKLSRRPWPASYQNTNIQKVIILSGPLPCSLQHFTTPCPFCTFL